MKLKELFRLSHREFEVFRTRSRAAVITIGVLFGFLLAILFVFQGLENVALRYAGEATNGEVYLVSYYDGEPKDELIAQRIEKYNGEIMISTEEIKTLFPDSAIVAKFKNVEDAYNYSSEADAQELKYNSEKMMNIELFGKQVSTYRYFRNKDNGFIRPASIVLMAVAAFILAFTMAHLLASDAKTFVLYRSLGASKRQLGLVYLFYLLEICFKAMLFAVGMALILSGIATGLGWNYLLERFALEFPDTTRFLPVLIGFNLRCLMVLVCMLATVPVGFLLCLDQFSNKKMAEKLKGD